ncbi:ornithine aminotransferase, mitochondrial-like isoform X1 [Rutidosis leptorrhynchoides]|uniref:ornithine aminotransferase, mitochondrial-like isoform X1 n=1 Tax=Rutidosis leptorrhynchoides TaxID=125765 RepID=UPI003A9A2F24
MASRRCMQQLLLNQIKRNGIIRANNARYFSSVTEGIASSTSSSSSRHLIDLEHDYSAHNYHPVPIVFSHGKGSTIWDPEGKRYLDFLAAYSAVNQGHCHPKIMKALIEQAQTLTLSSRAFYNDKFPVFAEYLTKLFGYDMVLPMNTGAEGVETAIKLARKWGYEKKRIPKNQAMIVSCCGCFHGRTMGAISMSCDNDATRGFWPLLPGQLKVDFGDEAALKKLFEEKGEHIAGFLFEPIQGEAGVCNFESHLLEVVIWVGQSGKESGPNSKGIILVLVKAGGVVIPPDGYLKAVRELCSKYNILMIADEIQSGIARSGRMLACDWEGVRPDVVILGKALGGGVIPVSAVLADKDVMLCIQPGEHGSTFGGNPLASAVAIASLQVVLDEKLAERSAEMGEELRRLLTKTQRQFPEIMMEVRGKGLFNAVELFSKSLFPANAYDLCIKLKERGILAKPTHNATIRLTPPLSISLDEIREGAKAFHDVLEHDLPKLVKEKPKPTAPKAQNPCDRCGRELYG